MNDTVESVVVVVVENLMGAEWKFPHYVPRPLLAEAGKNVVGEDIVAGVDESFEPDTAGVVVGLDVYGHRLMKVPYWVYNPPSFNDKAGVSEKPLELRGCPNNISSFIVAKKINKKLTKTNISL